MIRPEWQPRYNRSPRCSRTDVIFPLFPPVERRLEEIRAFRDRPLFGQARQRARRGGQQGRDEFQLGRKLPMRSMYDYLEPFTELPASD